MSLQSLNLSFDKRSSRNVSNTNENKSTVIFNMMTTPPPPQQIQQPLQQQPQHPLLTQSSASSLDIPWRVSCNRLKCCINWGCPRQCG